MDHKKARRPLRSRVTRIVNEMKLELEKDDRDLKKLRVNLHLLQEVMDALAEIDLKVMDSMMEDDVKEEEVDEEYESVDKYKKSYLEIKLEVEQLLQPSGSPTASEFDTASSAGKKRQSIKLPKTELRKYNGDLQQWLTWWSQYKKIHELEDLHSVDKFQYLSQSMEAGTEAKELVDSYPQTEENYEKAVEALKQRFGREDLLLQVYVRELLTLVISNVTSKEKVPLPTLYLKLESHLRSLSTLNLNKADPATWLFPLVESSLSDDILRAWQRSPQSKEDGSKLNPPKTRLDLLLEFMKIEVQSEQQISLAKTGFQSPAADKKRGRGNKLRAPSPSEELATAAGLLSLQETGCAFCGKNHPTEHCRKAFAMTLKERKDKLRDRKLCFQCLIKRHRAKNCKVPVACVVCGGKHYPVLCDKSSQAPQEMTADNVPAQPTGKLQNFPSPPVNILTSGSHSNQCSPDVLLNTLQVYMTNGEWKLRVRIVGDTGSQRSYIRTRCLSGVTCQKIGEEWIQNVLFGGTMSNPKCNAKYLVHLYGLDGVNQRSFELLEQEQICGRVPRVPVGPWMAELQGKGIWISDEYEFHTEVDILLGNDYWGSILTGRMECLSSGLVATETIFGWTLGGRIPAYSSSIATVMTSLCLSSADVSRLWSLEAIGVKDPIEVQSKEEEEADALQKFSNTVTRDTTGRYVVSLPFKMGTMKVPTNRGVAEKRLRNTTSKLKREGKFQDYDEIFKQWEKEGFIVPVPQDDGNQGHYLPHRPVFKMSSTTPVRPVFDASSKAGNNLSLNECLYKGPNLLELIPTLLLRFRENNIGVTADIRKAFQMVGVRDEDQVYQKFLWWKDENCVQMKTYKHVRVVFGVNSSPFLLGAVINHHLENVNNLSPVAKKLKTAFYVDNCVTSVNSEEEYEVFRDHSAQLLAGAQMELRQWAHSLQGETGSISGSAVGVGFIEERTSVSVLGIQWDRVADSLACEIKLPDENVKITKRQILSTVAQMFDPIGILSPVTLIPKLMIQESWAQKIGWEDTLPEEMQKRYQNWSKELCKLNGVKMERHMQMSARCKREVHIFCDASQYAYAAVAFMRSEEEGRVAVRLIMAKSRLAPIKKSTIPRLELMGCLIGTRLARVIRTSIDCSDISFHFWSDSSTALAWIRGGGEWGAFVSNRRKEILEISKTQEWKHVPGIRNPADLPSRGCSPAKLLESAWWEGPEWLWENRKCWPNGEESANEEEVGKERKKTTTLMSLQQVVEPHFSSYRKNVAVWGWVKRFVAACKKTPISMRPFLLTEEMRSAEKDVLLQIQRSTFPMNKDQVGGLVVRKDEDGLLRVQTKLLNRKDASDFKEPVLLPKSHPMVDLLISDVHKYHGHGGLQFLVSKIREKYWILQSRRVIRKVIRKCATCRRYEAKAVDVDPASLPERRVMNAEPFETTGVDLAGPLFIKSGEKVWVVLYTCAVYRSVYLDIVSSLSTEAFMRSLERFISLYGRPSTVYSDNGTNFVGTINVFRSLNWQEIQRESNVKQIAWILSPPTGAWWGGWWERLVRSMKDLLKRMIGKSRLTFDELRTCLAGVSATINDRPLTVVTEDNGDLIPLTPSMFLRRRISGQVPELSTAEGLQEGYKRMKALQKQLQDRFRREYLAQLVMRKKGNNQRSISVGDVVLVGADNKKRFEWPLGVVVETIPGRDDKIRVVKVKTAKGLLTRPLQRLYPLEVSSGEEKILIKDKGTVPPRESKLSPELVTCKGRVVKRPTRYGQWFHLAVSTN